VSYFSWIRVAFKSVLFRTQRLYVISNVFNMLDVTRCGLLVEFPEFDSSQETGQKVNVIWRYYLVRY